MQVLYRVYVEAEGYVAQKFQERIPAPASCPHCGTPKSFWALGYYERNLSGTISGVMRIRIRRFRCIHCGKTVSFLPDFAQPYRLVQSRTIHRFFCGHRHASDIVRWYPLLQKYWHRFERWLPEVRKSVSLERSCRPPPTRQSRAWWISLVERLGDLVPMTVHFVSQFHMTLFGGYRFHEHNRPIFEV